MFKSQQFWESNSYLFRIESNPLTVHLPYLKAALVTKITFGLVS